MEVPPSLHLLACLEFRYVRWKGLMKSKITMPTAKKWQSSVALSTIIVLLDQSSKIYFNSNYQYGEVIEVIPGFFGFTLLYNPGAAFNLLYNAGGWQNCFLSAVALAVSAWLGWGLRRNCFCGLMRLSVVFIIGGALGNVIDRILHGHVIDFIQLHYYGRWSLPVFNLADLFICMGATLMVLDSLRQSRV